MSLWSDAARRGVEWRGQSEAGLAAGSGVRGTVDTERSCQGRAERPKGRAPARASSGHLVAAAGAAGKGVEDIEGAHGVHGVEGMGRVDRADVVSVENAAAVAGAGGARRRNTARSAGARLRHLQQT